MHMGTLLQQVCDLAYVMLTGKSEFKNSEAKLKYTKRLKGLLIVKWKLDLSSLATKDLAEKKWNTPLVLPMPNDVMKFRKHLIEVAESSVQVIENDTLMKRHIRRWWNVLWR